MALADLRRLGRASAAFAGLVALQMAAVAVLTGADQVRPVVLIAALVAGLSLVATVLAERRGVMAGASLVAVTFILAGPAAMLVLPISAEASASAELIGLAVAFAYTDGLRTRLLVSMAAVASLAIGVLALEAPPPPFDALTVTILRISALGGGLAIAGVVLVQWRQRVQAASERYHSLYDGVPVGLVRTTTDGRILDANPALVALLRFPDLATLLRTSVRDLYHDPEQRATVLSNLSATDDEPDLETRVRRWDGSTGWVRTVARVVRDAEGAVLYYEAAVRDITEVKQREAALAESQASLRLMMDQLPAILWTTDRELRLTSVDGAPLSGLGLVAQALVGREAAELAGPGETGEAVAVAHHDALAGHPASFEIHWNGLDLRGHVEPLRGHDGVIGTIGIALDVTEQVRLESQLRQAHKMEAIGRLAGGIAHDFNNLLTAILGYAALAKSELPDGQAREEIVQIEEAADRAASLTSQLLAFGRRQLVRPKPVPLQVVVDRMEPLLRRLLGEHIAIVLDRPAFSPTVMGDQSQLEQVVLNLALNARDAMPTGGTLTIAVGAADLDAAFVWEHPGSRLGRHALLSVTDDGSGIDPAIREHLFEPFFSTKEAGRGTGLGLATVYGIVKQAGGYIDVRSAPGEGTTFDIYLPLAEADAPDVATREQPSSVGGGAAGTILLVEDEALVRSLALHVLRSGGYDVTAAADGVEALQRAPELGRIDLLVTDVVMPGIGGTELARRLSAEQPGLPVLLMTGYPGHDGLDADPRPVLQKPFTPEGLLAKVRAMLVTPARPSVDDAD